MQFQCCSGNWSPSNPEARAGEKAAPWKFSAVILPAGRSVCHVEARLDLFLGGAQLESSRWSLKPPVFLQPVRSEDSCLSGSELVLQYIYILFGTVLFMKEFLIQLRGRAWSA